MKLFLLSIEQEKGNKTIKNNKEKKNKNRPQTKVYIKRWIEEDLVALMTIHWNRKKETIKKKGGDNNTSQTRVNGKRER